MRRDRALLPWLALLPVVLLASMVPLGRAALALVLATAGTLTARMLARWRKGDAEWLGSRRVLSLAVGSIALAAAPTLLAPVAERAGGGDPVYDVGARLLFVLYGWGATLAALDPARGTPTPGEPPAPRARQVAALVGGAFVYLALAHAIHVWRYAGPGDDVLYLLQSRLLGEPGFVRRLDPALARFFAVRQTAVVDGRLFTQYPPGWPAVLALLYVLGARWWSGVLLGAIAVWLTYALGRRLRSPFVGAVAAALLAASFWLVQASAMYGAHALTTVCIVAGALLLLRGETAHGAARGAAWAGAGFLLGGALATRPLTGASVGLSLVAWVALRRTLHRGELLRMVAALAAGAVGPV
ncbi:MAG: glycosyltransferase family 39 protein, partial [Gemmatimonadaceae bacterium]